MARKGKRFPSDDPNYRRQKAGARAAPAPKAHDVSGFRRPRRSSSSSSSSSPRAPALADLALEESAELAAVTGGECPACHEPHGDGARHCPHCGAGLRRVCSKCDAPIAKADAYCAECGTVAPSSAPPPAVALEPAPPPPLPPEWKGDDLFFVGWGVDAALVHMDGDRLDDEDRDRINSRAADVANKHFRVGGRWKEEIKLGMAIAGALLPTAYAYYVIAPDARKRAERAQQRAEQERAKIHRVP
jgi:hypothetical protein